jgi:hypothetical protein
MRTLLYCVLTGLCFGASPALAQGPRQPFTARISAERPAVSVGPDRYIVKEGPEVFVTVHMTNTSGTNLAFGYDHDSRTGICFGHRYEVRGSDGLPVPKRTIKHPEIFTGHGWPPCILKPGESMDIEGDHLSLLYDLSGPGAYAVQLSRALNDDPKNVSVKSNTITLTVAR